MNTITLSPALTLRKSAAWLWAAAFVAGNILFPRLCHIVPEGGKIMLPIMLFTVIGTVRFGLWCGLLTAIASPLASVAIFGMPTGDILTAVFVKSVALALAFGLWREWKGGYSVAALLLLVTGCQAACFPLEGALLFGMQASWHDLAISWPGMLLQFVSAVTVVKYWK